MSGFWVETDKGDQRCRMLADRHYSRQSIGDQQWTRPGYNMVLFFSDEHGSAVFCWWRPRYEIGINRKDGLKAIECTIFRNETRAQSSTMILDAVAVLQCWKYTLPAEVITSVNSEATASRRGKNSRPGECFRQAGFIDLEHQKGRADVWLRMPGYSFPRARRAAWEPRSQLRLAI